MRETSKSRKILQPLDFSFSPCIISLMKNGTDLKDFSSRLPPPVLEAMRRIADKDGRKLQAVLAQLLKESPTLQREMKANGKTKAA